MKYRVVKCSGFGYEAQCRRWWWPFWEPISFGNAKATLEESIAEIERRKSWHPDIVVWREAGK